MQTPIRRHLRLVWIAGISLLCAAGASVSAVPAGRAGEQIAVALTDINFVPNRVEASVGDTIHFTNEDTFDHDIYVVRTANRNDVLVPATTIESGGAVDVTIEQEGLFSLYCTIHGGMRGLISTIGTFELTPEEKARAGARHVLPPIVTTGKELFWGRAQCHQCHSINELGTGTRGPDLADIGFRATVRAQRLGLTSATDYIVQSVLHPSAYLVEGYSDDMATVYQPPIDLSAEDITAIVAYLQSQGGEVDTWGISIDKSLLDSEPALNPFEHGDAEAGRAVFESMRCYSCHEADERTPITAGPDLSQIGAFRNWAWLAQSVIDPNAEVGSEWHQATVFLKNHDVASGFLRGQTEAGVEILTRPEVIRSISAEEIDELRLSELSKMPTNYSELITFHQMADLIAYLQTLRGDADRVDAAPPSASTPDDG